MRSIGPLAVVTGMLLLASGCSDGAGTPPPDNTAPVAKFDMPACTIDVPCDFVSTSTDDAEVTGWSWDFNGDGTPDATTASSSYKYTSAGTFDVSLTVRDAQDLSSTKTSPITIAPAPVVNTPPTAGFTYACTAVACSFVSTSTDAAPGTIKTYAWTFGDGATADGSSPSHSYAAITPTDYTVTLTVTEFLILHSLAQRPGVVKSRDALMDSAYDEQVYVDDRTIDSHIKRLRKKFKAVDDDFEMIETLYGVGYRFREA